MNALTFSVSKQSGDYIKASVGPTNRSEEARFGLVDGLIIAVTVVFALGVVSLFLLR